MLNRNHLYGITVLLVAGLIGLTACKSASLLSGDSKEVNTAVNEVKEQTDQAQSEEAAPLTANVAVQRRRSRHAQPSVRADSPTAQNGLPEMSNTQTAETNISGNPSPSETVGTQIGNAIVNEARKEGGAPPSQSIETQMADQISDTMSSPNDKDEDLPKSETGKTFMDIGVECYKESLRKAFNNL